MTRRLLSALAALGLVSACALPPQGVTQADLASFDAAVASIGCDLVDESDYLPVELQTGLSRQQVTEIAEFRVETEDAVKLSNGGVRLVSGACATS